MNSKIIFWFLKKTHEHSISQAGTRFSRDAGTLLQGGDRWVKFHEESLDFHPRFFPVFEEKREN